MDTKNEGEFPSVGIRAEQLLHFATTGSSRQRKTEIPNGLQRVDFESALTRILGDLARAHVAFCLVEAIGDKGPIIGWRVAVGHSSAIRDARGALHALPDWLIRQRRCVFSGDELSPQLRATLCSYFEDEISASSMLFVVLRDDDRVVGLAGFGRDGNDAGFFGTEAAKLEELVPLLSAAAFAQATAQHFQCEAAVLRAIGPGKGIHLLLDRARAHVIWADAPEQRLSWQQDIAPIEQQLASAVEHWLSSASEEPLESLPPLPLGRLTAVAEIEGGLCQFDRCVAVRIQGTSLPESPVADLSCREHMVACLLVKGYATANVAAITGLTENTVRTYVRRLYRKLGVCNRADLVRKMLVSMQMAGAF